MGVGVETMEGIGVGFGVGGTGVGVFEIRGEVLSDGVGTFGFFVGVTLTTGERGVTVADDGVFFAGAFVGKGVWVGTIVGYAVFSSSKTIPLTKGEVLGLFSKEEGV